MRLQGPLLAGAFALLLLAAAPPAHAQTIQGRIVDADTGEPLGLARIELVAGNRVPHRTRSAADGTFLLSVSGTPPYRLRASRVGYEQATSDILAVSPGEVVDVDFRLSATAVVFEPLTVVARVAPQQNAALRNVGFYERQAAGFGRFLLREDIERHSTMVQAIRRLQGVHVDGNTRSTERVYFSRAQALSVGMSGPSGVNICFPIIFLDGMRIQELTINNLISTRNVEAIEIYRSPAETPVQFQGSDSMCGVIVIWSRVD